MHKDTIELLEKFVETYKRDLTEARYSELKGANSNEEFVKLWVGYFNLSYFMEHFSSLFTENNINDISPFLSAYQIDTCLNNQANFPLNLLEKFLRDKNRNYNFANTICNKYLLPLPFLRRNYKYFSKINLARYQKFSFRFAWLMRKDLSLIDISSNTNLSDKFKRRFQRMVEKEQQEQMEILKYNGEKQNRER